MVNEPMNDTYTPDEFARCYSLRGYGRKKDALAWMQTQGIEEATDADFERCYHDLNVQPITSRRIGLWCDGTNQSAPQNMGNSRGKSYNAQMMQAQREIDATERWVKKRKEMENDG